MTADAANERAEGDPRLAALRRLKTAIVHDWLTGMRGGERCLEVFCEVFPAAPIFTLFHFAGEVSEAIGRHRIETSFLQRLPGLRRRYRRFLPLFPRAVRGFDLSGHDLILSLSHCVAKGARAPGVPHLSYCFTPMRYLYDQAPLYFNRERYSRISLFLIEKALGRLRRWDLERHPDRYLAISSFVAGRIRRHYGRDAGVVHPPADTERFRPGGVREDFYLIVSSLAPYKRIDLAVLAANRLGKRLVVVGKGEEERRLARMAGPTVSFLGWRPDVEVARLMASCRAFILPGEEDFGIAPVEAMACGKPVIALGKGGALETVVDWRAPAGRAPTGILFPEPTADALAGAMLELERRDADLDSRAIRAHAERFSVARFREEIIDAVWRFGQERGLWG